MPDCWIRADWDAPPWIKAGSTTRLGGVSEPPFDSFNLAEHVQDDPDAVRHNRRRLRRLCALPDEPRWLLQTHSNRAIEATAAQPVTADATYACDTSIVCAILTADCVPVLLCDRPGTMIAAVHVGWRGLCSGVLENALRCLGKPESGLLAWLGPHICRDHYEVGEEVRNTCLRRFPGGGEAFRKNERGRWQCCLETLIRRELQAAGIVVTSSGYCTFEETDLFYSYRRSRRTGRMASLIWMDKAVI